MFGTRDDVEIDGVHPARWDVACVEEDLGVGEAVVSPQDKFSW